MICTKAVIVQVQPSLCWWRGGVFLSHPGSSICCRSNVKAICDFFKNNPAANDIPTHSETVENIDWSHFFKGLWNMHMMLHLIFEDRHRQTSFEPTCIMMSEIFWGFPKRGMSKVLRQQHLYCIDGAEAEMSWTVHFCSNPVSAAYNIDEHHSRASRHRSHLIVRCTTYCSVTHVNDHRPLILSPYS